MNKLPATYLIYGANSAIGAELARNLLPEVEELILFYHENTDRINNLLSHDKVTVFDSDITDYETFVSQINQIKSAEHLAAVYFPAVRSHDHKPLSETSLSLTKEIVNVNILGAIHFLKGVINLAKAYKQTNSTHIVLLGSNVSRTGLKNGSVYAATKAAIANLVRSVAMEEGKNNILINTVSPGPVMTENPGFETDYLKFRSEYFETQKGLTGLNRLAEVNDVCELIRFLSSLDNKHITGEEIFLTGGAL